jgi:hypothetical protein
MKIKWKPIILFIITMIITLGLEKLITPDNFLKSPMYLLLPIVGFFAMYYLTKPIMNYMKIKNKYLFIGIFIIVALAAFYIMLFIYFWNIQAILGHTTISFNFLKYLKDSAYLEFLISCILGGISI